MDNQIIQYYGLINQGATCYLNSVLQVLCMTRDFKSAVERYSQENPHSGFIDHDLGALFKDLKTQTTTPEELTRKLSIDRVNEPRDAAEYFEKILHLASPAASKIFSGILTHRNTCLSCQTTTESDSPFWHLPLALVSSDDDNYSVSDGIKEHFKASIFLGEDQIYCDSCCAKSDFEIDCVMKQQPDVLLLLLKRFELDYRSMKYIKNTSNIDIPCSLQIPTTNQTYELYAVVNHYGDLRNGHYTATIKDGEDWYRFSDHIVTMIYPQHLQMDTMNAYLLFYKKQNDCKAKWTTSCLLPTDNDVHVHCGDAGEAEEWEKVKVLAGVRHEVEEPGTEDLYSDGSSRDGSVNEKKEITCAQMSVDTDIYGQCADLKQSETRKAPTETEEHGENRATHPCPTTFDLADVGKTNLAEKMSTATSLPNRKRMLAANLGAGSHQRGPALERNDSATERTTIPTKRLVIKSTETEFRDLKQSETRKAPTQTEEHGENRATHPCPTTFDLADVGKINLAEKMSTATSLPNRKRMLAANLGAGSHQRGPALERNDSATERTTIPTKRLVIKSTETEFRDLKQSETRKAPTETEEHGENRATHPCPTTFDLADVGKINFIESVKIFLKEMKGPKEMTCFHCE